MYLHIGENVSISEKDIIGIFDIDKTTTFIVVSDRNGRNKQKVYISPISASTLKERSKNGLN